MKKASNERVIYSCKKIKNESIGAKLDPTLPGNVAEEVNVKLRNSKNTGLLKKLKLIH